MNGVTIAQAVSVDQVKAALFKYLRDNDVDSAVLMQALAEVVGMTAAILDRDVGRQSFTERMQEFEDVAFTIYRRGLPTTKGRPL